MNQLHALLDDDDQLILLMYEYLDIHKDSVINVDTLSEFFDVSRYVITKNLEILSIDINLLGLKSVIKQKGSDFHIHNFSTKDWQKLREFYLKRSLKWQLLYDVFFLERYDFTEFTYVKAVGRTKSFSLLKELNIFLEDHGLEIKRGKLIGDESVIRRFFFKILFYFSIKPGSFFSSLDSNTKQMIRKIEDHYHLFPTLLQYDQLYLFLAIQFERIKNSHIIKFTSTLSNQRVDCHLWPELFSTENDTFKEQNYLSHFLYYLGYLPLNNIENSSDNTVNFMKKFKENFPILTEKVYHLLEQKVNYLHNKWLSLGLLAITFISDEQLTYFQENFPHIHHFVREFIEKNTNKPQSLLSDIEKIQAYYDYMFILLTVDEIRAQETEIEIMIDFSGGVHYNQFIQMHIEGYNYLNLKTNFKLTTQTDLYISDFYNERVPCKQIIWKNPPLAYDWEKFATDVIAIRRKKVT